MRENILKYLACPDCNEGLELQVNPPKDSTGHIIKGELTCTNCKTTYPIIDGIPFFCTKDIDSIVDLNRNNFASEWNYFTSIMSPKNEALAKGELDSYFHPLITYKDLDGKIILDGGCGGGRFTYIVSKETRAKEIFAIDLSNAVFTAFNNTKHFNNVTIIQADITKLPFKKEKIFDFIYSVGVLHHLLDPEKGFNSLVNNLKPDGNIFVWVYGKEGNLLYITLADPIRKAITSKLPFKVNLALSFIISAILWSIIWLIYYPLNLMLGEKISCKMLPLTEYFNFFRKRGFKDFWRTVFDKMVPTISYYISKDEFTNWFTKNNLEHKISFRNGHSWSGISYPDKTSLHKNEKAKSAIN